MSTFLDLKLESVKGNLDINERKVENEKELKETKEHSLIILNKFLLTEIYLEK